MQSRSISFLRSQAQSIVLASRNIVSFALAVAIALLLPAKGHGQNTLTSFEDTPNAQQDVFYRGADLHIYLRYFTSALGWQVKDLTTLSGAPLAASLTSISSFQDDPQGQQHVVFESANGHLYDLYSNSNPAAWTVQDLTASTGSIGAAIGTPLVSYVNKIYDIQYVFYLDINNHVNLAYWHAGWKAEDLTAIAGVLPAALGSKLTGFQEDGYEVAHVFYEGVDQHVHEFYAGLDPATILIKDNTADSGATPAALGSSLTSIFDETKRQENVFFTGIDQHIHHLSYDYTGPSWKAEDVTANASGVAANLGASLTSFQDLSNNQLHVLYIGIDQRLHQFYYSTVWSREDITTDAGAPLPSLNSPLTSFKDDPDNQQSAFFLGADTHFYHVYFTNRWFTEDLSGSLVLPAI